MVKPNKSVLTYVKNRKLQTGLQGLVFTKISRLLFLYLQYENKK